MIAGCAAVLAACGQVHPGHVGIKVNQYGSGAGVVPEALGVGTYFTPIGTNIIEYPVYTQTYTYTAGREEGAPTDESFTFNDKNGLNISADIGVSYSVQTALAPALYSKFRTDAKGLVATQIRNAIRNSFNDRASAMGVEDIYGARKQELLTQVQTDVAAYFKPYGLTIEKLFWAGPVRLPQQVHDQINLRISNEQAALAAQANVATKWPIFQQGVVDLRWGAGPVGDHRPAARLQFWLQPAVVGRIVPRGIVPFFSAFDGCSPPAELAIVET